ncbi:MAG: zinc ABC transporter ATP-binding protein ZnuC [Pseudomonadales bacterium]|nr:zinc ABC transporter ATP-binding protein ZnuC [Pseudomonadales bacterium]
MAARDISKDFAERKVLQNVSLELTPGKAVTLIGPNGAGKTTLVRILLGLLQPDAGRIERRSDLRIGYMPQRLALQATLPLTVDRFLKLANKRQGSSIAATLQLLNIEHLAAQQMISISGGELQRVLLARALLQEPQLLVLDEPAQGVDLNGQAELYQLIGRIRAERGCAVLMISHDLQLVMSTTDEVICLNHHVCCHGEPEQVSTDPAFLDLFGPNLSPGLALYTHHHNHEHDIAGEVKPPES